MHKYTCTFRCITITLINKRYFALRTKGSGIPSGVDANGFRRILASKSFKKSGTDLRGVIAAMTRRFCTKFIDPLGIEAILANRLFPSTKEEGAVRPIGVGEVIQGVTKLLSSNFMHYNF